MAKSCYVLELSVVPGGARRADLFTYNRLVHVRRCLEQEFFPPDVADRVYAAALAGSGETIVLWVVEGGRLVRGLDLHRHIRVRVGDDPPILLTEAEAREGVWKDRLADGAAVSFVVDWDAIAAETPALHGDPLRPGEVLDLELDDDVIAPFDSYLEIVEELRYGYDDVEFGEMAPPGFVDPDPPTPH
jgi:hypothetical protein